jgi:hypothetical protein
MPNVLNAGNGVKQLIWTRVIPSKGRMIVGIQQVVLLQCGPIVGGHGEIDYLP